MDCINCIGEGGEKTKEGGSRSRFTEYKKIILKIMENNFNMHFTLDTPRQT